MQAISNNHYSVDGQAIDAMDYIEDHDAEMFARLVALFPEWERRTMDLNGSWFDTETMGVDQEWGSWLVDAIEVEGLVWWEDGEPWAESD